MQNHIYSRCWCKGWWRAEGAVISLKNVFNSQMVKEKYDTVEIPHPTVLCSIWAEGGWFKDSTFEYIDGSTEEMLCIELQLWPLYPTDVMESFWSGWHWKLGTLENCSGFRCTLCIPPPPFFWLDSVSQTNAIVKSYKYEIIHLVWTWSSLEYDFELS